MSLKIFGVGVAGAINLVLFESSHDENEPAQSTELPLSPHVNLILSTIVNLFDKSKLFGNAT